MLSQGARPFTICARSTRDHAPMRRFVQALSALADDVQADPALRDPLRNSPDDYNIGQDDMATILVGTPPHPLRMHWGLVPRWSPEPRTPYTTVTARLERAAGSRLFGQAWRERRGVLPLSGYYKWDRSTRPPRPWFVQAADGAPLLAAVLWEAWHPEQENRLAFSVLTHATAAIPPPLTPDGPVFLHPSHWREWLEGPAQPLPFLRRQPAPALVAWPVSRAHRDRSRHDYTLIEPAQEAHALPGEDEALDPDD